jgi:hypothetical protein
LPQTGSAFELCPVYRRISIQELDGPSIEAWAFIAQREPLRGWMFGFVVTPESQ